MADKGSRNFPVVLLGVLVVVLVCGAMLATGFVLGSQFGGTDAEQVVADPAPETMQGEDVLEVPAVEPEADVIEGSADEPASTGETAGEVVAADETVGQGDQVAQDEEVDVESAEIAVPFDRSQVGQFSEEDLEILWEVWSIVEQEFDGTIPTDEELRYAVIRGVLAELGDDFTRFADPEIAARMREDLQGTYEGIGAFVRENDDGLTEIVRPIDGQPAEQVGLKAGDVVVAVNGESVLDSTLDEVISLIRGPRGTEVSLSIRREGLAEPFDVTVRREQITIPIVESEMLDGNVGYVHLTSFNRNAVQQLSQAVQELLAQNPEGLILDLRDNPGGFLDQSIAVADLFLPEGVVLYERSSTFGLDETYRSQTGDIAESIPLVVLINEGSASASEIVAGAIQDNERAVLIGAVTFGKGSVQQSHTLSDGSELRVTIARWYTPDNVSIDKTGITPDIAIETPEDLGGEADTQLQRALEFITSGE